MPVAVVLRQSPFHRAGKRWARGVAWLPFVAFYWLLPAAAAQREVEIVLPAKVVEGGVFDVLVRATTDAGAGERVGFLHAEYTVDGGRNWVAIFYEQDLEATVVRSARVTAGAAGGSVRIRARVAFRGGVAGDVDYNGAAIRWGEDWPRWRTPPTRYAETKVLSP